MKRSVVGIATVLFVAAAFPSFAQVNAQNKGLTEWNSFTQQQKDTISNVVLFAFVKGYNQAGAVFQSPTGDFAKASKRTIDTMFEGYVNLAFNAHPSYTLRDALVYAAIVTLTAAGVLSSPPPPQK